MDSSTFSIDDVEVVAKSAIASVLTESFEYKASKVNDRSNAIIGAALKGLQSLNRPYKYVITVCIMQKNGAGLVSAASTFWDASKDGRATVVWENQTTICLVVVYGTCVNVDDNEDEEIKQQDEGKADKEEEGVVQDA